MLPVKIAGEQFSARIGEIELDEVERADACTYLDVRHLDRAAAGNLRYRITFMGIQRAVKTIDEHVNTERV